MKKTFIILMFSVMSVLTACKDYYNETIQWTEHLKKGTDIETVKRNQPDFIEVAWDKPDTMDKQLGYEITKIKGNNDILKMQHFLIFIDDKYEGRRSQK